MQWPPDATSDPRELRALAHPRRLDLLELLLVDGPLTASQCAARLSDTPANCSYHLRTLARFGHVEQAGGGRGRERPWRLAKRGRSFTAPDEADPTAAGAARAAAQVFDDRRLQQWIAYRDGGYNASAPEWQAAAFATDAAARVSVEELASIRDAIATVLEPFVRRTFEEDVSRDDERLVLFLNYGFPMQSPSPPESSNA